MENFKLDKDMHAFCVRAKSFPEGILEAHQTLHSTVPFSSERNYFGISRPEGKNEEIVYRAGMTELKSGELKEHELEEFVIKKGMYTSEIINDYKQDVSAIGKTFDELLKHPDIDPEGACIEWYLNDDDVMCMVRLEK